MTGDRLAADHCYNTSMKRLAVLFSFLLLGVGLALAAGPAAPVAAQPAPPSVQRGYSYAAYWNGLYSEPNADAALADLRAMGVEWVSIVVTQYQDTINSTAIGPTDGTPTDADVRHAIRAAHALGLSVMLKPHVDLWNDPNHWRGEIGPNFSNAQWNTWFASYQAMISHYAGLAAAEGVEQFAVGTELNTTVGREANWRAVIAAVRAAFPGTLTYAGDWTNAPDVPWWDALDLIGVDAYYPLAAAGNNTPTKAQLVAAWQPLLADLAALSTANGGKRILFTEVGYRSQNGAAQHPWEWQSGGAVDLAEQALLVEVAFEQVFDEPWFAGAYWWAWDPEPYQGGVCDNGYTVHDKPAEDIVRQWYGASPRDTTPPPPPDDSVTRLIYGDALAAGWENWSWGTTVNFNQTAQVAAGAKAILADANSWSALSLYHAPIDTTAYDYLSFYVRQAAATTALHVTVNDGDDNALLDVPAADCRYTGGAPLPANTWQRVLVPLSDLGAAGADISRVTFLNTGDGALRFWLDDIRLVAAAGDTYLPIVLTPTDDAYVQSSAPKGKYGNKPTLRVRDAAADMVSYLKFDVAGLAGPPARATLRLYASDGGPSGGALFVVSNNNKGSSTPWREAGLTWRNAPPISGAPLATTDAAVAGQWLTVDVTAAIAGNGPISFALRGANADLVVYSSSEGARPPELVIDRE